MSLLSLDPGETTGYVIVSFETGGSHFKSAGFKLVRYGQIPWIRRHADIEALFLSVVGSGLPQVEAVVVESFRLYSFRAKEQIGNSFPSVRIIGIVETFCYKYNLLDKIVMQSASEISRTQVRPEHRAFLTSEHMRDAYRHARLWLLKNNIEGVING